MSLNIYWFIPTFGDTTYLGQKSAGRTIDFDYSKQIAIAADTLGYDGVLIPTGRLCEDPWVTASSLLSVTKNLKFLIALRPGLLSPSLAARMTATFDRFSNGRIEINLVVGGDSNELKGDGIYQSPKERYEAASEFIDIWSNIIKSSYKKEHTSYNGKYHKITNAILLHPIIKTPRPPIFFGGSSKEAKDLASQKVDVYLIWGEKPDDVKQRIDELSSKASKKGKKLRFGIRLHVIVREEEEEAWRVAEKLISKLDENIISQHHQVLSKRESIGQRRMTNLTNAGKSRTRKELEVSPNLWAGIGLAREGCATALVGSPEIVAKRINEYAELGIDTFIFSGYPHLEESYKFAELIFPLLKNKIKNNLLGIPRSNAFGGILNNETHK